MNRVIAVSANALTNGGGLSILQQFIDNIADAHRYYIFISTTITLTIPQKNNICLIRIPPKNVLQRIAWDSFGLKQWLKKKDLVPDVVLSLQNTSVAGTYAKHIIYLHQGLSLYPKRWSFFKKNERALALYKYIYPLFIFMHTNKNTQYIVQTEWMKDALCKKFKRNPDRVSVIKPDILRVNIDEVKTLSLPEKYTLFYPANDSLYKNHQELLYALYEIKTSGYDMSTVGLYLTVSQNSHVYALVKQLNLHDSVHFVGTLSYNEALSYYQSCTTVVFPSYIESFGLPLLEAAMFGKPMVVIDAAFAREVLDGYSNVYFAARNASSIWGDAILNSFKVPPSVNIASYVPHYDSGWQDVFQLMNASMKP